MNSTKEPLTQDELPILLDWIKTTFVPSRSILKGRTSYGLKHEFERSANGFYITNDQFKEAMQAAGFAPVKEQEGNWRFKIEYAHVQERKHQMAKDPFTAWLLKQRDRDEPIGDLAKDVAADKNWPVPTSFGVIYHYLERHTHALEAFEHAWDEWQASLAENKRKPVLWGVIYRGNDAIDMYPEGHPYLESERKENIRFYTSKEAAQEAIDDDDDE